MAYKKKLIEADLPLDAINMVSARETVISIDIILEYRGSYYETIQD